MEDIHEEIVRIRRQGDVSALATVVCVKGSTPRAEGSKILIRKDGSTLGSVGGGCLEAAVWQAAMDTMKNGTPALLDYDLTGRQNTPEGLICGGTMQVFVDPVAPKPAASVYEEIVRIKHEGNVSALATVVCAKGSNESPKMLIREDGSVLGSIGDGCFEASVCQAAREVIANGTPRLINLTSPNTQDTPEANMIGNTMQVFVEPIIPQPTVYIFGAGHIGFAVSKIAKMTGFRVAVIDDRPAYANAERFPDADEFYVEDPADMVSKLNINKASYLVIACRGHLEDQRVLAQAIKTAAGYIGLLGSRKKTKTVFSNLRSEGVLKGDLDKIHSPIGLPIATETPEEIAVSIMAEIIDVRRRKVKT